MNAKLIFGLALVFCAALAGASTDDWKTKAIGSEADLDKVIARLQAPATRFGAMLDLLDFACFQRKSDNHDPKVNALDDKAVAAMQACPGLDAVIDTMIAGLKEPDKRLPMIKTLLGLSGLFDGLQMQGFEPATPFEKSMSRANEVALDALDVPTTEKALADPDWGLRLTAAEHFGEPPTTAAEWKKLLPQMEKVATEDEPTIRAEADGKLHTIPGTEEFLDGRLAKETSAEVIIRLLDDRNVGMAFENIFLARFFPLLSNADEKVRVQALWFVAGNSGRAKAAQFPFGMDVFDRAIVSAKSKSAKERAAAACALVELRELDVDRSREVFVRLAHDPDAGVRQEVAAGLTAGLAVRLQKEDVKKAIAALLKDKSPRVRFMTILALGPRNYIPELEELAKGDDAEVAELAAEILKGLK